MLVIMTARATGAARIIVRTTATATVMGMGMGMGMDMVADMVMATGTGGKLRVVLHQNMEAGSFPASFFITPGM